MNNWAICFYYQKACNFWMNYLFFNNKFTRKEKWIGLSLTRLDELYLHSVCERDRNSEWCYSIYTFCKVTPIIKPIHSMLQAITKTWVQAGMTLILRWIICRENVNPDTDRFAFIQTLFEVPCKRDRPVF